MPTDTPTPLAVLKTAPFIPVVTVDDAEKAVPLAQALVAGGVKIVEVTLRTPAAFEAIQAIARDVPDILVGAGTILSADQFPAARDAGAQFFVGPGTTAELLAAGRDIGLPYFPGTVTPSEVMAAKAMGFTALKFFPAVPYGAPATLRYLADVFPDVAFCPTGGVDGTNFREFLALPNVVCVGGAWVAPRNLIQAGNWAAITDRAAQVSTV